MIDVRRIVERLTGSVLKIQRITYKFFGFVLFKKEARTRTGWCVKLTACLKAVIILRLKSSSVEFEPISGVD